jgi:cell division protein FtsN
MTRDDEMPENTIERSRRFDANSPGNNSRQEPSFSNLEDLHEDGYEEPDRDTNFASGYRADNVEDDEEYDDTVSEDDERELFVDEGADTSYDPDHTLEEDSDNWLEQAGDLDEQEGEGQNWPLGLVAVGVFAVVLLAAGGYGVLQQRAAAQEELQELRAALAVAGSPAEAGASRGALETLQQSYDKLSAQAQALTLENRRLADTVAGLEAQLGVQQSVPGKAVAAQDSPVNGTGVSPGAVTQERDTAAPAALSSRQATLAAPPPAAKTPATPAPATADNSTAAPQQVASSPTGPWFVNFGTYATRNMADTWASRVSPIAGEVIVAPNDKDGRTLYRVRVVGLADRESAQQVARKLESDLRVSQLWVGRE